MNGQPTHCHGRGSRSAWSILPALALCLAACQTTKPHEQSATMVDRLANRTTTVYPTVVMHDGRASYDHPAAEALAAFITSRTGARAQVSDERLTSATPLASLWKGQWREGADALKGHIQAHPVQTDLAAMAVYRFLSDVGPTGIYAFLTNSKGDLLARIEINESHDVFRNARPRTAEDCTALLLQVLESRRQREERGR